MHDLLKILFVFGLIVTLLKFKWNLGSVMLLGAVVLGLLMHMSPAGILGTAWHASIDLTAVSLIAAFALIMVMENQLRTTETLKKMVDSLKRLSGDQRLVMALMPAIVGILPSAGGAFFSAPMVESTSEGEGISPRRKSFINYWFRHIWEYISPLYPGFLLLVHISGAHMESIFMHQIFLTLTVLLTGALFAFKGVGRGRDRRAEGGAGEGGLADIKKSQDLRTLLLTFSPILVVMILVMILKVDIAIALGIVVAGLFLYFRYDPKRIYRTLKDSITWKSLLLVWGVLVFSAVMQDSGAVRTLPGFFKAEGIPVLAIIFIVPFLVGMITGITLAYVGITFPMIVPLIGGAHVDMGMLAFAYAAGFAGIMFSPVHLCLVLTKDYFKSDIFPIFRLMLVPELIVLAVALGEALLF
ncbi:MAG: DUF401 family protein [Nitrospirota bacterium]